jgi:hypothetical protein
VRERAERVRERAERVRERAERVRERAERVRERAERVRERAERERERERGQRERKRAERESEREREGGHSPDNALLAILAAVCKLSQAALVDAVDLLADGASRVSGVLGRHDRGAVCFAAHDCSSSQQMRSG